MKFIDFQGGRMGPVHYDLASFVWQARARYPSELKAELTEAYLEAQSHYEVVRRKDFLTDLRQFVLFRTLQVLGAYGFRGMFERRPHFLESIPYAMDNLRELMSSGTFPEYPCLYRALEPGTRGADTALRAQDAQAGREAADKDFQFLI